MSATCWLTFYRHDQTNCLGKSHYSWSGCSCLSGSSAVTELGHHFLVSLFPVNPSNEENSKIKELYFTVHEILQMISFQLMKICPPFYQESFSVFIFTKCSLLSLLSGLLSFVALSSCSSSSLSVCSVSLSTTVVAGMVSAICFLFRSAITFSSPGVWLKFYKYVNFFFFFTIQASILFLDIPMMFFQCQVPMTFHQTTYLHNSIEETRVSKVTQPFNFGQYYTRVKLRIMFDGFLLLQFRFFIFGCWTVDRILRWIFCTGTRST